MEQHTSWYYISKVTLDEAWDELKTTITVSLFFGIFILVIIGILSATTYFLGADSFVSSTHSELNDFLKSIPWWITTPTIISLFFWFARGQKIQLPKLDFKLWLIITLVQFAAFACFAFLPWWVMLPVYYLITSPLLYLDRLIEIGQAKVQQENQSKGTTNEY